MSLEIELFTFKMTDTNQFGYCIKKTLELCIIVVFAVLNKITCNNEASV